MKGMVTLFVYYQHGDQFHGSRMQDKTGDNLTHTLGAAENTTAIEVMMRPCSQFRRAPHFPFLQTGLKAVVS
jgi:hypothetical protein